MRQAIRFVLTGLVLACSPQAAFAAQSDDCQVIVRPPSLVEISGYNSQYQGDAIKEFIVEVDNKSNSPCDGSLVFGDGSETRTLSGPRGGRIQFSILSQDGGESVIFTSNRVGRSAVPFSLSARERKDFRGKLLVPGGQRVQAGEYIGSIPLVFQQQLFPLAEADLPLQVNVVPSVSAELMGASYAIGQNRYVLDFGDLKPGLQKTVSLRIDSTASVGVEIESENSGRLKYCAQENYFVPYDLDAAGQRLSGGHMTLSMRSSASYSDIPLVFTIGDTAKAKAGDYCDMLTLRISAR